MIRRGSGSDIPEMSAMMAANVPRMRNKGVLFAPGPYEQQLRRFMFSTSPDVCCLVSEANNCVAAFILCYIIEHPAIGERVGGEASWLAHHKFPGHGRAVLKAAITWFGERGAARVFIGCNDDRTARLLELLGLNQTERLFEKVIDATRRRTDFRGQ